MDHADFEMVCLQACELVGHAFFHFVNVACTLILAILPDRTEMGLEDELVPPAQECPAQVGPEIRIGCIHIDAVYAISFQRVDEFLDYVIGFIDKAFTAHADFTDHKACIA